jgi:ZIP family zinc transporter
MIAASFWSLLQPAKERAEAMGAAAWLVATSGFVGGALFIWHQINSSCPLSER